MKRYKFVCTLDFGDVLVQTLVWIILVVCTFGLALPFFAYFFIRLIINKTEMHEISGGGVGTEPYIRSEPGA
ncbi:DUF6693 family protein [Dechloromonas sp. CZR5]|uniref:DUF6693 family protein n=1 Tax=Dechloromonas sp. CZR5 TaxID=2608630 RepID=UPI00123DF753